MREDERKKILRSVNNFECAMNTGDALETRRKEKTLLYPER